jgi:hypothetical protein
VSGRRYATSRVEAVIVRHGQTRWEWSVTRRDILGDDTLRGRAFTKWGARAAARDAIRDLLPPLLAFERVEREEWQVLQRTSYVPAADGPEPLARELRS